MGHAKSWMGGRRKARVDWGRSAQTIYWGLSVSTRRTFGRMRVLLSRTGCNGMRRVEQGAISRVMYKQELFFKIRDYTCLGHGHLFSHSCTKSREQLISRRIWKLCNGLEEKPKKHGDTTSEVRHVLAIWRCLGCGVQATQPSLHIQSRRKGTSERDWEYCDRLEVKPKKNHCDTV